MHNGPTPNRNVSFALLLVVETVNLIIAENNNDAVHKEGGTASGNDMVENQSGMLRVMSMGQQQVAGSRHSNRMSLSLDGLS